MVELSQFPERLCAYCNEFVMFRDLWVLLGPKFSGQNRDLGWLRQSSVDQSWAPPRLSWKSGESCIGVKTGFGRTQLFQFCYRVSEVFGHTNGIEAQDIST